MDWYAVMESIQQPAMPQCTRWKQTDERKRTATFTLHQVQTSSHGILNGLPRTTKESIDWMIEDAPNPQTLKQKPSVRYAITHRVCET
ncbi:Hypothetical predicted protein, partial [Pelobates cultripes]